MEEEALLAQFLRALLLELWGLKMGRRRYRGPREDEEQWSRFVVLSVCLLLSLSDYLPDNVSDLRSKL